MKETVGVLKKEFKFYVVNFGLYNKIWYGKQYNTAVHIVGYFEAKNALSIGNFRLSCVQNLKATIFLYYFFYQLFDDLSIINAAGT